MKARKIHLVAFAVFLVVYHFGYILVQPEMIRKIMLQESGFKRISDIAVDTTPVIEEYFPLGAREQDALTLAMKNGLRRGHAGRLRRAESGVYDESLAFYKSIRRGFAGWEILGGCDNQVIVLVKLKDKKIADVEGLLKKDCIL